MNPCDDLVLGPVEMRRLCRLHGARLLWTGNPSLWLLVVGDRGWYLVKGRYLASQFHDLLHQVRRDGWPGAIKGAVAEEGRGQGPGGADFTLTTTRQRTPDNRFDIQRFPL